MNVAVLGASIKKERYSYKAVKLLTENGHAVFPVHPVIADIDGIPVFKKLTDITSPIHTVTVYLGAQRSTALTDDILAIHPRRVIFNPGAENDSLAMRLRTRNIEALDACTLVLLRTNQFESSQRLKEQCQ